MTVQKLARIALLSAILYVSKLALDFLPNIELVSLFIILYTLVFGKETLITVTVFNLLQIIQWGIGTWTISYLYVWPFLCLVTLFLKKLLKEEFVAWSIVSGLFGLIFGSLFAALYLFVDPAYALSYWIAGLPWDVWHAVWNFVLMLVLGKPLYTVFNKMKTSVQID